MKVGVRSEDFADFRALRETVGWILWSRPVSLCTKVWLDFGVVAQTLLQASGLWDNKR